MGRIEAVEEICRLKHAYFRLLDTKQFSELGELMADDVTTAYSSVPEQHRGRAAVVDYLTGALADPGMVTFHQGHHPEIDVHDDGTATGIWYLEDRVIVPAADLRLEGTAFYDDRYVLVGGRWKIHHTGYQRLYEERRVHSTGELLSFRHRFQTPPAAGSARSGRREG